MILRIKMNFLVITMHVGYLVQCYIVKLLSFYRKCFDAIELSNFCKQTQSFNYKIDLKTKHHPSVIFWSAGGQN